MVKMASEQPEEWTVVTAFDKKRVMRKSGVRRSRRTAVASGMTVTATTITDSDTLYACLQHCQEYVVKTNLWAMLVEALDYIAGLSPAECAPSCYQIVAYGIGNFSQSGSTYYSAALWQLALAVCLQTHFPTTSHGDYSQAQPCTLVFFDPCSTDFEKLFLSQRLVHCQLLTVNDRGQYPVQTNVRTLFFMPHCPAQLYENVVACNFDALHENILVLGNSLRGLAERRCADGTQLQLYACLNALQPYLHETQLQASSTECHQAPGNLEGAVNDTYLCWFRKDDTHDWPPRPDAMLNDAVDPELL